MCSSFPWEYRTVPERLHNLRDVIVVELENSARVLEASVQYVNVHMFLCSYVQIMHACIYISMIALFKHACMYVHKYASDIFVKS